MIECSLGDIKQARVLRSLSGYTTVELALPLDNFVDSETFELTTDKKREYKIIQSEVYPTTEATQVMFKVTGLLKSQEKYFQLKPQSFEDATAESILTGIGIKGGSQDKLTFVNLTLTQGQLAILAANSTAKTALVDFEAGEVKYYEDLYKAKAKQVEQKFQRIVQRVPQVGVYLYEEINEGVIPEGITSVTQFGDQLNLPTAVTKHFVENYNSLAKLFSSMQLFSSAETLSMGSCVLSPLTFSKGVICAIEETWYENLHTSLYYVI